MRAVRWLLVGCLLGLVVSGASAQAYPYKTIRLICPFTPGGAVDIASRAIAAELTKTLGQSVTVESQTAATVC